MSAEAQPLVVDKAKALAYSSVEEGFVPEKRRKASCTQHGNSPVATAAVIVSDCVGAGMLTMPSAIAAFGWVFGGILLVANLAMHIHMCMMVWRMHMHFKDAHSLSGLVGEVFSKSPERQRRLMVKGTEILQNVFIFFLLAADVTSLGKGLGMLFHDVHICLPHWALIGSAVMLPIHWRTRSLDGMSKVVYFNCIVIMASLLIPIGTFAHQGPAFTRPIGSEVNAFESATLMKVLSGFNIMTFNFTMQFMVVEIAAEMKEPAKFPLAFWGFAFPFLAAVFILAGLAGYYFLGNGVQGIILNNLSFGVPLRLCTLCLVTFVVVTYVVKSVVFCRSMHAVLDKEKAAADDRKSWLQYDAIVTVVVATAWLVSQVIPFFTPFVEFCGATMAPLCCMLLPIVLHIVWVRNFKPFDGLDRGMNGKLEWALIGLEFLIALIVLSAGTAESVETIISGWSTSGSPFACHCQQLWSTCACSAGKLGPLACPNTVRKGLNGTAAVMGFTDPIRRAHLWEF